MTTPPTGPDDGQGAVPATARTGDPAPWTWRERAASFADMPFRLPVAVAAVQVVGTLGAAHNQPERQPLDALAVVLLLAGPAVLVLRRRFPVATLCLVLAVSLAYVGFGYPLGPFVLSPLIALVGAVRHGHRAAAWLTAAALYGGHIALGFLVSGLGRPTAIQAVIVAGWMLVVLIGAELLRIRDERREETHRAAAAEAAGRVTEERLRIARELHDVVAHNISLINVQAGVALHLMDAQPEQARTALTAIRGASKEALVELRSVLGVLRQVDEEEPRQPAPGLRRLDELAERTRQAGLDVRVELEGEPRPVPSGVDVAAYRIVQEALTNVLRHAGADTAQVRVRYAEHTLTVEVVDDGAAAGTSGTPGTTGGSGIAGMRERASALGGDLTAGPAPGGGFRVWAELPTEGTA